MGEAARKLDPDDQEGTVTGGARRRRFSPADIRAAIAERIGPIETEQEDDGRWLAEARAVPGAMAYGSTREAAIAGVKEIGLRLARERTDARLETTLQAMPGNFLTELDAIGTRPPRQPP